MIFEVWGDDRVPTTGSEEFLASMGVTGYGFGFIVGDVCAGLVHGCNGPHYCNRPVPTLVGGVRE